MFHTWLLIVVCTFKSARSQLMSVDTLPVRAHEFNSTQIGPIARRSVEPYQVFQKLAEVKDDGESFKEGPLNVESRLATRLVWKSFEADINQRIEDEWMYVPIKVLSGYGQVVSGMQYDLRVLAGTSNCSRYEVNAYTIQERNCVHFNGPKRVIFNIIITERSSRSWNPFIPDWERMFSTVEREVKENEDI